MRAAQNAPACGVLCVTSVGVIAETLARTVAVVGADKTATMTLIKGMEHIAGCAEPRRPFLASDPNPESERDVADREGKSSAVLSLTTTPKPLEAALHGLVAATW